MNPDPLRNEIETAEYLGGISVKTVQKWRWKGEGPRFTKLGGRVLYRQSDLDAFIIAGLRTSTSDPGSAAR